MASQDDLTTVQPDRIGPYRIVGQLGAGGMGVVYQAVHEPSGAPAAVKMVRLRHASYLSSIRREIHALERARHPGVVRILEQGLLEGLPWYAMELLLGPSLEDLLRELWPPAGPRAAAGGRLPEILTLIHRLCDALAYLHGEGIIHRDIKPENVALRPDGTPVLVDFGLVERFAGAAGRESLDLVAAYAGSLHYMAPEQLRGLPVDPRADLYAVGCLLYELLSGETPFSGPSSAVVIGRKLAGEVVPPSQKVGGVPAALDDLVLRLLHIEPRRRIGYAEDVMQALRGLGVAAGATAHRPYVYRPSLAGREAPLKLLGDTLHSARRGRGTCALLIGESGLGKTYLAMEITRRGLLQGFSCITGTCGLPTGAGPGAPLHPFAPLLHAVYDLCIEEGQGAMEALLGPRAKVLASCVPALARLPGQEGYPDPPELPAEEARERLFLALRETITALCRRRPLLLVLDDLQWADELTLGFLGWLPAAFFEEQPLVCLLTCRADEPTEELARLQERPHVARLRLQHLDEPAVGALVGDMLAMAAPLPFVQFLTRRSGGNPFFVAESLRAAVADGLLSRGSDGAWQIGDRAGPAYDSLPLPHTLAELIGERLDRLPPASRALIEVAAVLGKELDGELLLAVAGTLEPPREEGELLGALSDLLARQLLEQPEPGSFLFVHDLVRERAYSLILPGRRRALHRAAALRMEQAEHATADATLAGHFVLAEMPDKALHYLTRAGEQALRASAHAEAARSLAQALELDEEHRLLGPLPRARLLRLLSEATFAARNVGVAAEHLLDALALLGHPLPRSRLGTALGVLRQLGTQVAHRLLPGRWLQAAPQEEEHLLEAAAAARRLTRVYILAGERAGVLGATLLAANLKDRTGAHVPKGDEYAMMGLFSGFIGLTGVAERYFTRAHESTRRTGDVQDRIQVLLLQGTYLLARAEWTAVLARAEEGLALCQACGNHYMAGLIRSTQAAFTLMMTGQVERAFGLLSEFEEEARAQGRTLHLAWAQLMMGRCLARLSRYDELLQMMEQAIASLRTVADIISVAACHALMALAHLGRGDLERARKEADRTRDLIQAGSANTFWAIDHHLAVPSVYLTCWERGLLTPAADPRQQALRACAAAERHARLFPVARPAALRHRGWAEALKGRREEAIARWTRALELACSLRIPYEEALAHYELGRHGDPGSPQRGEHLARARRLFAQIGCADYLRRIDELQS
jgi:tetratricopeptide (TPR) repeat protein